METLITVIHIITAILLVLVVLIQSGKGADVTASLGGSSQTIFGSSGGANFFTRFTAIMAAIFMATSMGLTLMHGKARQSIFETESTLPSGPISPKSAEEQTDFAPITPDGPSEQTETPAQSATQSD